MDSVVSLRRHQCGESGENTLKVEVTNLRSNRLTGDAFTGEKFTKSNSTKANKNRITWTELPLIESDLLGSGQ